MNAKITVLNVLQRIGMALVSVGLAGLLVACGGGSDAPTAAPPPPAAAITAQPTDQSAVAGTSATFSVTATNASGYQWQRSSDGGATFADVAGATATSHTTAATTPADNAAQVRVVVSGAANSVTSSAARLTVTAAAVAPGITMQPAAQTITAGQSASFSVTAAGTALTYQWQHSMDGGTTFTDEAGATAATFTLTAVAQLHNGHFLRVVVSNSLGSVTSTAALLTVNAATGNAPAFTTQPISVSITEGQNTQFSVTVTGAPVPTLDWQVSVNNGAWFSFGTTTSIYAVNGTTVGDSGRQYRVVATNGAGSATSNAATLTVSAAATAPVFTTQPASVTIAAGQSTSFTVAASGTPTPTFQWQLSTDSGLNFSNITGATDAVFQVLNAAQGNNGRQFRAVATNSAGPVNSTAAILTVTPPSLLTIETATALPPGVPNVPYSTTLSAAGGTPPYRWSSPGASVLQSYGLTINSSTGQISGTPTAVDIVLSVDVIDSSSPPQSAQKDFSLIIQPPCDSGFGTATVAGAPSTVEGKFCPQRKVAPGVPNVGGLVFAAWLDDQPGPRIYKGIGVEFYAATGQIASVSFNLNDPTRLWTYQCLTPATDSRPACSGVTVDMTTGTLSFANTVVGSGTSPPFTLNGVLRY